MLARDDESGVIVGVERRGVLKTVMAIVTSMGVGSLGSQARAQSAASVPVAPEVTRLQDRPLDASTKITVERRGEIALFGINRTYIQNRMDPETFQSLAKAYYDYDHDPSLRAAILFGHGPSFSRGVDVDAYEALAASGKPLIPVGNTIDPMGLGPIKRTKPLIAVVHGETWNGAHELFLSADVRVAAANTDFGQDEASHGRYPGGGSTIRFAREAGWGNAMRYMLTGDHWNAAEAFRMGLIQQIAPSPEAALDAAIRIAEKVAACGPLGIKAILATAHLAVDPLETEVGPKLYAQYQALYRSEDFREGRRAEAERRRPVFKGL